MKKFQYMLDILIDRKLGKEKWNDGRARSECNVCAKPTNKAYKASLIQFFRTTVAAASVIDCRCC